jgi:hypothetical protein
MCQHDIADRSMGFVLTRVGRKLTDSSQIICCNHVKPRTIDGHWCVEAISSHFDSTDVLILHHNTRVGDCSWASHFLLNQHYSNRSNCVVVAMK